MPRPTKTDDPRRTILTAARALLLRDGHTRLSLRAVAERAGFGPASLYEYFDGKDALFSALAEDASRALTAALARAAGDGRDPAATLVNVGLAYIRYAREHREDFMLLFTGLPSQRRTLQQSVPGGTAYGVLADAVRRALVHRGARPRAQTVDTWAYGLWAAAHGMAMLQGTHLAGFGADFPAADRRVLSALVRGWLNNT